jgi:hypothetical protein
VAVARQQLDQHVRLLRPGLHAVAEDDRVCGCTLKIAEDAVLEFVVVESARYALAEELAEEARLG